MEDDFSNIHMKYLLWMHPNRMECILLADFIEIVWCKYPNNLGQLFWLLRIQSDNFCVNIGSNGIIYIDKYIAKILLKTRIGSFSKQFDMECQLKCILGTEIPKYFDMTTTTATTILHSTFWSSVFNKMGLGPYHLIPYTQRNDVLENGKYQ